MYVFFFFNDTATTEIYTLSLHDALPIFTETQRCQIGDPRFAPQNVTLFRSVILDVVGYFRPDRKSTRLNSSHLVISYAVFCLKKKNSIMQTQVHVSCNRPHGLP